MTQDHFIDYARTVLNATAFMPDPAREGDLVQAASLASIQNLLPALQHWRNAAGEPLSITAGFIERMTPNASADRYDGRHYVVMHQALMTTITEFALFAFTQAAIFPEIGKADDEDSPLPAGGYAPGLLVLRKTLAGEAIHPEGDRSRVPKDAERHVMAIYCAILMARFVWLHEIAHCHCGHVDYAHAQRLAQRLHEVPEPSHALVGFTDTHKISTLHLMELEADAIAVQHALWLQADDAEDIAGIAALPQPMRLGLVLFCAYAMTWLFEEYQAYMRSAHGLTHPRPRERLRHLFHHAALAGGNIDGFEAIEHHAQAQFDHLRRAIPNLHPWPDDADHSAAAGPLALNELLSPYRYVQA